MLKKGLLVFVFWAMLGTLYAQKLDYYLPQDVSYDSKIPTPASIIGHEVGEYHITHDKLVYYMRELARASERITLEEHAYSYEKRSILLLTVTSPANHQNIEQIRQQHLDLSDIEKSSGLDTQNMPAVVWAGYSIHGNESSGSNAALLLAYYLAAAEGDKINDLLKNTVVLLDPSYNPDGLNRFATWVNMHKSKNIVSDPNSREYHEVWPGGRTNHYWFDLNRDWLPIQHPESQGRITKFHEWKPNILTDHHEMGTDNTFFFQPGVPQRTNPLTPKKNQELTGKIGEFHAKALDKIGSLYYSQENFDDFYYGKGSTYPDANGSIGILFEQASSRGHAQESANGIVTFPFTIRNQFTTSLSTLEAAQALRVELLDYQRDFYKENQQLASQNDTKSYIFGDKNDPARNYHFIELLKRHQIEVHELKENTTIAGQLFEKESAYLIPTEQAQYRLIEAIFQTQTSFEDSLFYDVSAWTLPLAFDLPYASLSGRQTANLLGNELVEISFPTGKISTQAAKYAYLFEWDGYYAPRALNRILSAGLRAKVAQAPFEHDGKSFDYGTILVPVENQNLDAQKIHALMQEIAQKDAISLHTTSGGLTMQGIDLGSPSFESLQQPKILLVVGDGVRSYDAGEVWHLLDQRFDMKVSMLEVSRLNTTSLDRYNVAIFVSGSYSKLNETGRRRLAIWVNQGNTLILNRTGVKWGKNNNLASISFLANDNQDKKKSLFRPYDMASRDRGAQLIGGAIFQTEIDLTHPICYGYNRNILSVFRNHTMFMEKSNSLYATPVRYVENPLLSGYVSDKNAEKLKNTASVIVTSSGQGRVISMIDNPNFRAFWYGTNKLFMNAIFFGHTISSNSTR